MFRIERWSKMCKKNKKTETQKKILRKMTNFDKIYSNVTRRFFGKKIFCIKERKTGYGTEKEESNRGGSDRERDL